jgi:peptidase E
MVSRVARDTAHVTPLVINPHFNVKHNNVHDLEVEHDVVVGHFQNLETRRVLHNQRMESYNS